MFHAFMARQSVNKELWRWLQPSSLRTFAKGGVRKLSVSDEAALDGILFVQQAGIPLEDILQVLGYGRSMTCERCLAETAAGDAGVRELCKGFLGEPHAWHQRKQSLSRNSS